MKFHVIQHVAYENTGYLGTWCQQRNYDINYIRMWLNERLPEPNDFDGLIVLGGPMGVYDEDNYPWLVREKQLILHAIEQGKKVIGICLGAQLIANCLGAQVYQAPEKEIGFYPVECTPDIQNMDIKRYVPERMTTFHWHGDMFDIPEGATRLFRSKRCINQGFIFWPNVLALQFHLEVTSDDIKNMMIHEKSELISQPGIMREKEVVQNFHHLAPMHKQLTKLLDHFMSF